MNEQKTGKSKLDKGIFRAVKKDGTVYYRASLTYRGKHISLGSYRDAGQAHSAYEEGIRLLNDSSLSLKSYRETSSLSFEKWVCLLNFRDNGIYLGNPIYMGQQLFYYYLTPHHVLKLKKAGIDFVMLRVGARGYGSGQIVLDEYFADNLKRATDAGLQIGVYFTSQAITEAEAVEEANVVLNNIKDYKITYPVAFDMGFVDNDTARIEGVSRADKTKITKAFLDTIAAAGYKTLLYGNKEWLIKEVDLSKLSAYDVWLSQVGDVPDYPYRFTMWQYADDISVDGIAGYSNMNISFIDYSEK